MSYRKHKKGRKEEKKLNYYEKEYLQGGIRGITKHQKPPKKKKSAKEAKRKIVKTPNPIKPKLPPNLRLDKTLIYAISSSSSQASP